MVADYITGILTGQLKKLFLRIKDRVAPDFWLASV